MVEIVERIGRFTSSNIWKLTTVGSREMTESELVQHKKENPKSRKKNIEDGFGTPALTYIEEKRGERYLGRSLDLGKDNQSTIWGKIAEYYCNLFHLDLSYELVSNKTEVHPKYPFWSGSPDAKKTDTVGEIKCFEPKKYYLLSIALIKLNNKEITLDEFKDEFKDIFWQVVSNSILLNKKYAEIIAFMPTESQLFKIKKDIEETNILEKLGIDPWRARFIIENEIYKLPFVKNEDYPNFVSYKFEVPVEDKIYLTNRVINAEKYLNNG